MDFDIWYYEQQTDIGYREMKKAFEAGQQSKQAEVEHRTQVSAELAGELIRKQEKIDEALAEISRAMKCCESIETECVLTEIKELLK